MCAVGGRLALAVGRARGPDTPITIRAVACVGRLFDQSIAFLKGGVSWPNLVINTRATVGQGRIAGDA